MQLFGFEPRLSCRWIAGTPNHRTNRRLPCKPKPPTHRSRSWPAERPRARAGRQIDLASRAHPRRTRGRRDPNQRIARRARTCSTPARRCGAWRRGRPAGARGMACPRRRRRRLSPQPEAALDFGNSGTGCRLMLGAVAGCPITAMFDGDASLRRRPMRRVLEPLARIGARRWSLTRRPLAADARWGARAHPDRVRAAGCRRRS